MKPRLAELLRCPICKSENLSLTVFAQSNHGDTEIHEGVFSCPACQAVFPIIRDIPRLLPRYLWPALQTFHEEFFRTHRDIFADYFAQTRSDSSDRLKTVETMKSYSYQWQTFDEMFAEYETYFKDFLQPYSEDFFKGKLCLDAGAGFGRFSYYPARYGAEVVALELSEAVNAARTNNLANPRVHVVQGDLHHSPLRPVFDFVYCVGVLQHLPDPKAGFASLARHLGSEQSELFCWVYGKRKGLYNLIYLLRPVTIRLPSSLLNALCFLLAVLQEILILIPYRILTRLPVPALNRLARRMPSVRYAHYPFRHNWADWYDRLSVPLTGGFEKEEIEAWFGEYGFYDVHVVPRTTGWRAYGKRQKATGAPPHQREGQFPAGDKPPRSPHL